MNKNIIITPTVAEDIFELKDNLRAEDVAECQACGHTPTRALTESYTFSDECYSAKVNGRTEAIFGVSSFNQPKGQAVIWYLGSDVTMKYPISMVRGGREQVAKWLLKYDILCNAVDSRNTVHIQWLKHIGFTFMKEPIMVNGYEFLQFYKTKE